MFSYCRNCGKPISETNQECNFCGAKRNTRNNFFCGTCGASTIGEKVVCAKCNEYLPGSLQKTKSKMIAGLLAIFLGCFGIHKFYLGYFKEGFIILILYLILGKYVSMMSLLINLFVIVEGVQYLRYSDREFEERYVVNQTPWL